MGDDEFVIEFWCVAQGGMEPLRGRSGCGSG
eukprot:CAMPEP_0182902852 /NCGR_PEP_ID=MMETSP0034_2-20130328/30792_1 /TAXON_ID=156128 /ORGANISM="Nephroselmis pyriformis, Strain CCMP717" /LENGTH=30 /DNA_ID= /DNA_START= /DNA_END= /DNA_ORIENTATION=